MPHNIKLNFPPYSFRMATPDNTNELSIWDSLRGCYLILTPEEWVRQNLIKFMIEQMDAPPALISQEHPVNIQGMQQRADVVVYGCDAKPLLLAECKAPSVKVDEKVFAQAVRYNSTIGARYLLITNGLKHYVYKKGEGVEYNALSTFPSLATKRSK